MLLDKYRIGRNTKRAILEVETGKEYIVFPQGKEQAAQEYCDYLNSKHISTNLSEVTDKELKEFAKRFFPGDSSPTSKLKRGIWIEGARWGLDHKIK